MRKYLFTPCLIVACLVSISSFSQRRIAPSAVITGHFLGISRALTDIPPNDQVNNTGHFRESDRNNPPVTFNVYNPNAKSNDEALQTNYARSRQGSPSITAPIANFDGQIAADNGAFNGLLPPDCNGVVGPNQFVQTINLVTSVYSKTGTRLSGPTLYSSINPSGDNSGDPVVLYDAQADRWLLMQFSHLASANAQLDFSISTTNNPSGTYYNYSFITSGQVPASDLPDYPHIAIWNNMYIATAHEFNANAFVGQSFYAIDRNKMLAGAATSTLIRFNDGYNGGMLGASLEGQKTPDLNENPSFWGTESDETGASVDRLVYRTMSVDFVTPLNSWISEENHITAAAFDGRTVAATRNVVEQQGTANGLDALAGRMMSRVIYRRFDNYESIVMNNTVNVSGVAPTTAATFQAAIRWYEVRRANYTQPWTIYQQGTYCPAGVGNGATGTNYWMGAIDMDEKGDIALTYSKSSSTTHPAICYATRLATDALGTLGAEQTLIAGAGSQTSTSNRWGDYAGISVDPNRGDTVWITSEYYSANSASAFRTRIGSFVISPSVNPEVHFVQGGVTAPVTDATLPLAGSTCILYKDYTLNLVIDAAPTQNASLTLTTSGTAVRGVDYDIVSSTSVVLNSGALTVPVTVRVYYNPALTSPAKYAYIGYTLNSNGGNAVAATYNQVAQISLATTPGINPNTFTTVTPGAAGNVYTDNFDAEATGPIGNGWTDQLVYLTELGTNHNNWVFGNNGGTATAGFSGKWMYVSNNGTAWVFTEPTFVAPATAAQAKIRAVSPDIDITGKGQVNVSFTWLCNGETPVWDFGQMFWSIDGGTTWVPDDFYMVGATTSATRTVNLPANVQNIPNLKLGFQFETDDNTKTDPPLGIDNLVVTAKPLVCSAPKIQTALNAATAPTDAINQNQTINYADATTGNFLGTVTNNSTFNFGCSKVEVDRSGTSAVVFNSNNTAYFLASKTFKLTPANNSGSASYTVSLYYTEAEVAGWEAATGQNRSTLKVVMVNGNPISAVTPANQATFTYVVNASTTQTQFCTGGWIYTATFTGTVSPVTGFGIGNPPQNPLPVTLLSFRGQYNKGQGNQLTWVVTNQLNIKQYELQFSKNGSSDFATIATLTPQTYAGRNLTYNSLHRNYINGNNYYRVKTTNMDGTISYSSIVLINVHENGSVVIYPNPVNDVLLVNYRSDNSTIQLDIVDAVGQVMYTGKVAVVNPISIPVAKLASGNYILRITDGPTVLNTKFVKQ